MLLLLNPRRTRTNMKLLQLVWIFLLTLCGQSGITAMTVNEDDDVILDCSFGSTNIENEAFDWTKDEDKNKTDVFLYSDRKPQPGPQFKGRVFHFPDQLSFGNASIKIKKAKTSDSGTYTCYHAIFPPELRSTISLTVDPILKPRPEIKGASPQPIVSLHRTNDGMLLKCEVKGASPEPVVEWWDSDGNVLPADKPHVKPQPGNKYDVILMYAVTKTDDYRCVATQKEINHQVYFETHVNGPGGASKPYISIVEETKGGVLLRCEVFGASPELQVSWKNKAGHDVSTEEPLKTEKGGGFDIILQTTVTKTDYYRCVTTEGKKDVEIHSEFLVLVPDGASNGLVIGVGIVSFILGTIVVGVTVWCWIRNKKSTGGSTPATSSSKEGIL